MGHEVPGADLLFRRSRVQEPGAVIADCLPFQARTAGAVLSGRGARS